MTRRGAAAAPCAYCVYGVWLRFAVVWVYGVGWVWDLERGDLFDFVLRSFWHGLRLFWTWTKVVNSVSFSFCLSCNLGLVGTHVL